MLKHADLAAYIAAGIPNGTVTNPPPLNDTLVCINRILDTPDQLVMCAIAHGGRGFETDGAFQQVVVHTRSRATTDGAAETLALAVDAVLLNTTPAVMGAAVVRNITPVAGPPCFFERDVQNRTVYFCDYLLEVSR